jgi:signal transduction histidine kinase
LGLAVIAAIFAAQTVISVTWTASSQARARRLSEGSLFSIEQVTRIGRDISRERVLLDDHIAERDVHAMDVIEARLHETAADIARAEEAYTPFADLPNEQAEWREVQALIARFDAEVSETFTLSRKNRDEEARARVAALRREYADLDRHMAELIEINRAGALQAIAQIRGIDKSTREILVATGITGLLAVILVGWGGMRRIASYEDLLVRHLGLLEGRNRELDAFAGRIAHDLRDPLSSVTMTMALLSRSEIGARADDVERMRRGLKRIDVMIGDLLALSRIEVDASADACNPSDVAAQIRQDFVERHGEQATLREEVEAARVRCSEGLLRQALWNLVENGVKYRGHAQPQIGLSGRAPGGMYELRVADNGIGMSPEEAAHAFDPFYRGQRARGVRGTGLGLAIVKRIVDARGGTISVESKPEHGSTFIIRLPLADQVQDSRPR